ncbi:MAG: hypothetical protein AAGJ19_19170, partial [Myxococcota bacterium]
MPTLLLEPAEPEVHEVDDEMVLEVASAGDGVGLELGRSKDRAVEEPETQPRLEVKPPGPEVKETEPPPPAAPSKAE